ncbi:type II toxin-antitoxin system RelE/ParE family toxin [Prosthecobacter sp. SYSU 5D2]|uniref:type II toxin-antitoxin system RelE/ParE family toxin n=1 Tax=Prosthecobacter sp. SYSU 5D2 TaxID=3134134 RepID=UPI0031FEFDCB
MTRDLHPKAEEELHDSAHWYGERSLFAAERFLVAMENAMDTVMKDPVRYQPVGDGVRVYRLDRFPYKLYYEHDESRQHVSFLCIMHHKRRPEYWRDRVTGWSE